MDIWSARPWYSRGARCALESGASEGDERGVVRLLPVSSQKGRRGRSKRHRQGPEALVTQTWKTGTGAARCPYRPRPPSTGSSTGSPAPPNTPTAPPVLCPPRRRVGVRSGRGAATGARRCRSAAHDRRRCGRPRRPRRRPAPGPRPTSGVAGAAGPGRTAQGRGGPASGARDDRRGRARSVCPRRSPPPGRPSASASGPLPHASAAKGIVERTFGTVNALLCQHLPGQPGRERQDFGPRPQAITGSRGRWGRRRN